MQEICSFLKGSAEAMDCHTGKLSLEQYLEASLPCCAYSVEMKAHQHCWLSLTAAS